MKPRIAVLTNIPSPYQVELFDAIARQGHIDLRVWYCAAQDSKRMWGLRKPDHWHRIGSGLRFETRRDRYYLAPMLAGEIHAWRPDLGVFQGYTMPAVQMAMWRAIIGGLPWVYWGEAAGSGGNAWPRRLARGLGLFPVRRWAAAAFGIGHKGVETFRHLLPANRPVFNVPYFSDLARFELGRSASLTEPVTFAYIGSFIHRKGVDILAQAFSLLVEEVPAVRLLIAGDGDTRKLFDAHLSKAAAERVVRAGFVPWDELPRFYRRGHVLVMPSRYDGWGMVVPEAMASGLPVIGSTAAVAAVDLVREGSTGWLVPPGDVSALAAAMRIAATGFKDTAPRMRESCVVRARRYDARAGARVFARAVRMVLGHFE